MNNEITSITTLTGQGDTFPSRYSSPSAGKREGIMNINKTTLNNFRASFNEAVKELEKEYEVSIKLGNIQYGDISFTSKIEVTSGGNAEEVAKNRYEDDLKTYGYRYPELKTEHFDDGILYQGQKVRIVGIKPRSPKYPIIYQTEDGKRWKASYQAVQHQLKHYNGSSR